jgi:guanylate kinase
VTFSGVILYGPPASGKDTITGILLERLGKAAHFYPLKVGTGRTAGYRLVDHQDVDGLHNDGLVLFESERYGNRYVVDRPTLDAMTASGDLPIIHVGRLEGVRAVLQHTPPVWLSVLVWCSRATAEQRLVDRNRSDVAERLEVWDETAEDLESRRPADFHLTVDTDGLSAEKAADEIVNALRRPDHEPGASR